MLEEKTKNNDYAINFVTLRELSDAIDIPYQTLNYYTNLNLLKPRRRERNKRLYLLHEVEDRLAKITELKSKGYPLRVISDLLNKKEGNQNELL